MSVEFDEETKFNNTYNESVSKQSSGLTTWLIEKGVVKNEKGAKLLMIFTIILCFTLTIFLLLK